MSNFVQFGKRYLLNKYVIVSLFFAIWMIFFDQNSYLLHKELNDDISKLKQDEIYYRDELAKESNALEILETSPKAYEKLAREKYLMKKENEDIFVIEVIDTTQHDE